jgi:hypothetical protein
MPAKLDWTLTLYGATVDPATTAYTMVTASSVNAYTGASSYTVYITQPQAQWAIENEPLEDISGWQVSNIKRRRRFSVQTYPFDYEATVTGVPAGGIQDLDNVDALADLVASKKYLWAVITGGPRSWPSTAGQVHPVIVTGWTENINAAAGTRTLGLELELRGRQ